ncbi:hypothetical protein PV379_05035 [Streptomyces caniscabiei]|nr:hypothetical protein [Streptomyces caniscabiei]MDX2776695.1 hypothetical protein [Streptomyces caniscabiei]
MPVSVWLYIIAGLAFILAVVGKSKGAFSWLCLILVVLGIVLQINPRQ